MTQHSVFDGYEWSLLRSMPILVAGAPAVAEPGGIFGALRESAAVTKITQEFAAAPPENELLALSARTSSRCSSSSRRGSASPHRRNLLP